MQCRLAAGGEVGAACVHQATGSSGTSRCALDVVARQLSLTFPTRAGPAISTCYLLQAPPFLSLTPTTTTVLEHFRHITSNTACSSDYRSNRPNPSHCNTQSIASWLRRCAKPRPSCLTNNHASLFTDSSGRKPHKTSNRHRCSLGSCSCFLRLLRLPHKHCLATIHIR